MSEPTSSQQHDNKRHARRSARITASEREPSSSARVEIRVKSLTNESRFRAWDWLLAILGALVSLIVTAISSSQIPNKRSSTSVETILIIVGGLVVISGLGLLAFGLYRRFRVHRLERLERRLSGSDLRAINLFVNRELELLSTLSEGDRK
jgi:uncharacterized membrane protein YidH (DUF202 family)